MKFKTVLGLSAATLFLIATTVSAQPSIPFDGILGDRFPAISGASGPGDPPVNQPIVSYSVFTRDLGEKINVERKKHSNKKLEALGDMKIEEASHAQYAILSVVWRHNLANKTDIYEPSYYAGIYLANHQDVIQSYCLLSPTYLQEVMSDPFVQQVLALPQNTSYLQGQLTNPNPSNMTLKFYEQTHPNHIERYGVLSYFSHSYQKNIHLLVLDAYYSKELETYLTPQIITGLNTIMRHYRLESLTIPELEALPKSDEE